MTDHSFFNEQKQQSLVKATIIEKYFKTWASIIVQTQKKYPTRSCGRIAYIDLFAGPGRYVDGSKSTPVMILESAIRDDDFRDRLVTIFNDFDSKNIQELENTIKKIPDIDTLKYKPEVWNQEVGTEIVKMFEKMNLIPTLFFVDPWGYKGLSLRLINSVVKDWGCDAVFFFNYNRINMGLTNPAVEPHMRALFENQFDSLVQRVKGLDPSYREAETIESLCQAIQGDGTRYTLPFRFRDDRGTRTTHHLIFVSKAFKGYDEMKKIMYKESTAHENGVASFEYNPPDLVLSSQKLLFSLSVLHHGNTLDELQKALLDNYRGKVTTLKDIYPEHSVDKPFIIQNYKEALKNLLASGVIKATKGGKPPRKGTFADDVTITFPS